MRPVFLVPGSGPTKPLSVGGFGLDHRYMRVCAGHSPAQPAGAKDMEPARLDSERHGVGAGSESPRTSWQ